MIFAHTSLIQEGEAALFYNFNKPLNGYMIAGVIISDNMEAKMAFFKVWKYFVSEIVRADDIYCSIPLDDKTSMFTNYVTYHSTIENLKIYKVDGFLKKQHSSYEKHLEQAGNNL